MDYIDHHFRPDIAEKFGVDVAIFLHDIFYWVRHNKGNCLNFHDGRYWTYNTQAAFCEMHPYWSKRQIERIIATCKKESLLLTGCFNKDNRDRTTWYTLTDAALKYFCDDPPVVVTCNSPNGDMQDYENCDAIHQTVAALPDNIPDNIQDIPPKAPKGAKKRRETKTEPDWLPERFAKFWDYYSHHARGESRQTAIRAWDKLRPSPELIADMGRALQAQVKSELWVSGIGIPYASSWINQRRWEDPIAPDVAIPADTGGWAADPEVIR